MAKKEAVNISVADMTIGDHIDVLRKYLVRSAIVFLIVTIVIFMDKGVIVKLVLAPMYPDFPTNRFFDWFSSIMGTDALRINQHHVSIINTRMAGQLGLHIKSSLVGGLVISFPFIVWQIWRFIKPALNSDIIRQGRRFVFQASLWFFIGLAFGYFVIAPLAVNFLTGYQVSTNIVNKIEVSSFLSSVVGVSFAAAVIFLLPVIVRILAMFGILKASMMRKYRKIAIVVILIVAAIITPPDVVSQVLIAIPLYGLYEYGIKITARIEKRRAAHVV